MAMFMAVRQVNRGLDPFPAFATDVARSGAQFVGHELVEKRRILHPATIVAVEQVAHDISTSGFVSGNPDKLRAPIPHIDTVFGQHPPNGMRLDMLAKPRVRPDMLLPCVIAADAERHQLIERHPVLAVNVEQGARHRSKAQPLFDDVDGCEEAGGDFFFGGASITQLLERPELVERMERHPHGVFNQGILLGTAAFAHHAGNGLVLRHSLARDQKFQGTETAPTGGHFELAGLLAVSVQHRTDVEALKQCPADNVIGQLADGHAALQAADIGLAEHQLVERDVARTAERELGN